MLSEDETEKLKHHELLSEVGTGGNTYLFQTVALHVREKRTDELRNKKIEAGEDEGHQEANQDLLLIGEQQILEEAVFCVFRAEEPANGPEHLETGLRKNSAYDERKMYLRLLLGTP